MPAPHERRPEKKPRERPAEHKLPGEHRMPGERQLPGERKKRSRREMREWMKRHPKTVATYRRLAREKRWRERRGAVRTWWRERAPELAHQAITMPTAYYYGPSVYGIIRNLHPDQVRAAWRQSLDLARTSQRTLGARYQAYLQRRALIRGARELQPVYVRKGRRLARGYF